MDSNKEWLFKDDEVFKMEKDVCLASPAVAGQTSTGTSESFTLTVDAGEEKGPAQEADDGAGNTTSQTDLPSF